VRGIPSLGQARRIVRATSIPADRHKALKEENKELANATMKLYAKVSSERARKEQGSNNVLRVSFTGEDKKIFLEMMVMPPDDVMSEPLVSIVGATYDAARQLGEDAQEVAENALRGDGYGKLLEKANS
jgi:hypothetical protein